MDRRVPILAAIITVILVVPPSLWGGLEGLNIIVVAVYVCVASLATGIVLTVSPRRQSWRFPRGLSSRMTRSR